MFRKILFGLALALNPALATPSSALNLVSGSVTVTTSGTVTGTITSNPDVNGVGTIDATALSAAFTLGAIRGQAATGFKISGGAGGYVLGVQISYDNGTTWNLTPAYSAGGGAPTPLLIAAGSYFVDTPAATMVRLIVLTAGSGTITVASNQASVSAGALKSLGGLVAYTTASMTGTTTTSLVPAPTSTTTANNLHNYISAIWCPNSHATQGTDVVVQDGSGGTTLFVIGTALGFSNSGIVFGSPGYRQPTANTALYVANVTTGSAVICNATLDHIGN